MDGSDSGLLFSTGIERILSRIGGWHEAETLQSFAAMRTLGDVLDGQRFGCYVQDVDLIQAHRHQHLQPLAIDLMTRMRDELSGA